MNYASQEMRITHCVAAGNSIVDSEYNLTTLLISQANYKYTDLSKRIIKQKQNFIHNYILQL